MIHVCVQIHWKSHFAHDIYRWGPARCNWAMLPEKKLSDIKKSCKASNYHNPPKAACEFWIEQSDYQLRRAKKQKLPSGISLNASKVTASGSVSHFSGVAGVAQLSKAFGLSTSDSLDFLSSVHIHGVYFGLGVYCLLGSAASPSLSRIVSIIKLGFDVFFWLALYPDCIRVNPEGSFFVDTQSITHIAKYKLASATHLVITALWHFEDAQQSRLNFIPKW